MDKQQSAEWPLTGASFALAELDSDDEDFREMVALVDELQQRKVLPLAELPDTELVTSFLDEMELMELEHEQQQTQQAPAPVKRKKKKLSSTERRKRDKLLLLDSLNQLQRQLQTIQSTKERVLQKRWNQLTEQGEIQQSIFNNFRLRHALALEQGRVSKVVTLLKQLRNAMLDVTYTDANPWLQNDAMQDKTVFDMLKESADANYQRLALEWEQGCMNMATDEVTKTTVSPDGTAMTYRSARLFPFDMAAISDTVWRITQTGVQSGSFKTMYEADSDLLAFKEQLTIHPAGYDDVTLCMRVVSKRFVFESHSVFMWETVCNWSTPSSDQCSTTQESGWLIVHPVGTANTAGGGPVNVVQSSMTMTLIESSVAWMRLMQNSGVMLPMIVPSSHQVMLNRIQHVENCLLDRVMQSSTLSLTAQHV